MKILAVDQARHGGWAVFDTDTKGLLSCGVYDFSDRNISYSLAILRIESFIDDLIVKNQACAVYFEDIQMQGNVQAFKRLAQLQGVLINLCEKNGYRYGLIPASKWQHWCRKRHEISELDEDIRCLPVRQTKKFSLQYVRDVYGVHTTDDNMADAVCIGAVAVNLYPLLPGKGG